MLFRSHQFTEAGTFDLPVEGVAAQGCDSLWHLTVTQTPTLEGTDALAVCEGHFPVTFHGHQFTEAGTFDLPVEGVAAQGCDSLWHLTVTQTPTLYGDYYSTICDSQLPYEWHGVTFTEEGEETITVTGATEQGCDSIVTLHVTVNPTLYGDYYSTICDSQLPYEWHGVTFTEEGEETITVTGATAQGCDSIVTLHVTVNPTLYGDYYSTICDSQLP